MDEILLKNILQKKLNNSTEIEIHLFEFCNLSCVFCGQDHDSKEGFDTIQEKALDVIAFMNRSHLDHHIVNIMGGEVFNDQVPDELFIQYELFTKRIVEYANLNNQKLTINWVTNLIFNKVERIDGLLKNLRKLNQDTNLSTSYDFDGRGYAGKVNSIFAKNLERFEDYIYTIGFVLTSPAINNFLNHSDPLFERIYKKYVLYFDYYVPEERSSDLLMPSDRELYDAFIYTATHYPNIYPVKDWLENEANQMTCYSLNKLTILPDGRHVTCRYLKYKSGQFNNPVDYSSNSNIVTSYIEENKCLSCKWYQRCSLRCFVQADWAKREKMSECLYEKFFDKIVGQV
ncbi:MAG: radical SAM protein [Bdellovibrionota bacterium]|nr:radical SAM protein [Bdellovibrionota bacterium]